MSLSLSSSLRATSSGAYQGGANCDVEMADDVLFCLTTINWVGLYRIDGIGVAWCDCNALNGSSHAMIFSSSELRVLLRSWIPGSAGCSSDG